MGVEPFLLSSSLEVVMAQRLVRVLCHDCKQAYAPTPAEQERFAIPADAQLFHPAGCAKCNNSGYRGRTGIYELIEIDDIMRQLIHESAGEQKMLAHARKRSSSIDKSGIDKVLSGDTSLEEVLRVTAAG